MSVIELKSIPSNAVTVKPIPAIQNQVGPTCGLTALSIVMNFWYRLLMARYAALPMSQPGTPLPAARDPLAKSMRERLMDEVRDRGGKPAPLKKSPLPSFLPTMQDIAERMGSRIGEVAQAKTLAGIAREAGGFDARVAKWGTEASMIEQIRKFIDANTPLVIAYDNTDTGDPGKGTLGDRAHWAVLFGYIDDGGRYDLLATHGWGRYYRWSAETLRESNEQLQRYETKAGTWVNVRSLVAAQGGARETSDWNQRQRGADGYDLVGTHGKSNKVKLSDGSYRTTARPLALRSFASVDTNQDLARQLVVVTPRGEKDFSPVGGIAATTAPSGVGKGDLY
ncbi:MAG: hypothetical protein ABIT38_18445 [Gemmatimonadaceae bacterium]